MALALFAFNNAGAQILTPVTWTWKAEQTGKGEYKLTFTAKIDKGWHTYSQYIGKDGPVPTSITFDAKNKDVQLIGKTTETGPKIHEGHDPVFDMQLKYFEEELVCTQTVKVLKDTKLKGTLEFMVCDDSKCLPPDDKDFEFDLKAGSQGVKIVPDKGGKSELNNTEGQKDGGEAVMAQKAFDSTVQATIQKSIAGDSVKAGSAVAANTAGSNKYGKPIGNCNTGTPATTDKSLWAIIALGFFGGLIALLTPCVFPMIPLTVSFFTKRSESKSKGKFEALIYAFSIIAIYLLLALPFAVCDISSDTLNELSTGAVLNVFFFVIFVIFAFSFFGFYEISLPSFIANKADSASNIGGFVGIFFMALTLAIVSFSCTGPIVGALLAGALTTANGKLNVVFGLGAFGAGLALPFGFFALFPGMMKSLPKSGGWLDTIKKVLGFIELIFAFKFLSNADLVSHWGIFPREIFLGVWAIIGVILFLFLIGRLNLPHTTPVKNLSPLRITAVVLALAFAVYSAYGIPGNELHLFSGFPPPKSYSIFKTKSAVTPIQNDYEKALALAKKEGKPLMIDFTGWACVNCRKMEENVWTDPEVTERLTDKYVVLSLYVDDKKELPEGEQYISDLSSHKKIKTIGNKFSEMEAKYFVANTQPFYVLISPDEHLLNNPTGYTPNPKDYVAFLDCGLSSFKQLSQAPLNLPEGETLISR
jgi:thiol:disulfide interchange protein DsbD